MWNHVFLNFDAMPPPLRGGGSPLGESPAPLRGAARRPPALRPAGTVPPRHGAAGTVPGGYGASIEARFHRARHLVPAKAGTVSRRHGVWCRLRPARFMAARLRSAFGGPALRGVRNPGGARVPSRARNPSGVRNPGRVRVPSRACSLSGHAVPPGMRSFWACNLASPQSVKVRIWGGTAGPIGPAGMVPPIGGTVRCRAIARHGILSRLPSGAVIRAAFPGGQCRTYSFASGFWQGRRGSLAGGAKPCLLLEACAAGPIGPAGTVRRLADRVGRAADGGRSVLPSRPAIAGRLRQGRSALPLSGGGPCAAAASGRRTGEQRVCLRCGEVSSLSNEFGRAAG